MSALLWTFQVVRLITGIGRLSSRDQSTGRAWLHLPTVKMAAAALARRLLACGATRLIGGRRDQAASCRLACALRLPWRRGQSGPGPPEGLGGVGPKQALRQASASYRLIYTCKVREGVGGGRYLGGGNGNRTKPMPPSLFREAVWAARLRMRRNRFSVSLCWKEMRMRRSR